MKKESAKYFITNSPCKHCGELQVKYYNAQGKLCLPCNLRRMKERRIVLVPQWEEIFFKSLGNKCAIDGHDVRGKDYDIHHVNKDAKEVNLKVWTSTRALTPANIAYVEGELRKCVIMKAKYHNSYHRTKDLQWKGYCDSKIKLAFVMNANRRLTQKGE